MVDWNAIVVFHIIIVHVVVFIVLVVRRQLETEVAILLLLLRHFEFLINCFIMSDQIISIKSKSGAIHSVTYPLNQI